jgi:hypothetical protein
MVAMFGSTFLQKWLNLSPNGCYVWLNLSQRLTETNISSIVGVLFGFTTGFVEYPGV